MAGRAGGVVRRAAGFGGGLGLRRLLSAAAGLAAGRAVASLLSAVWLIIAARRLPLVDFGDLALLVATTTILINISDRGLQTQLGIHVARSGGIDRVALRDAIRRRLATSALCALANAALYLAVAHDRDPALPLIAAGSLLGTAVYSSVLVGCRALGRARAEALNEVISRAGVLLAGTIWLLHGGGLIAAISVYAAADVVSALVVATVVAPRHVRALHVPVPDLRLGATFPFAVSMILLTVFYKVDTYLVGVFAGSSQVAIYSVAYRLLDAVGLPVFALGGMVFGHSVTSHAGQRRRLVRVLSTVAVALTAPAVVASAVAGNGIMRVVFGAPFATAGGVLTVLMLSAVPAAIVAVGAPVVQPHDGRRFAWLAVAVLLTNVAANATLIPLFGALGAAYANLGAQAFFAVGVAWLALRGPAMDQGGRRDAESAVAIVA